jgi:hypothetical protein
MSDQNHAELVARVASRDEAAFNALYTAYLPLLLRRTLRETRGIVKMCELRDEADVVDLWDLTAQLSTSDELRRRYAAERAPR